LDLAGDEGNFINFINIYPDENGMTGGDTTENTGKLIKQYYKLINKKTFY
jgi:hypothetical protein